MPKGIYHRKQKSRDEIIARFWRKVRKTETCWLWTGAFRGNKDRPYGHCIWEERHRGAHIISYELANGPVPDGLELDHVCRNTRCVNPEHLQPVTHRENVVVRGTGPFADRSRQTHCKYGHEFTPENTYIHKSRGVRVCRACHVRQVTEAKKRKRP